MVSAQNFIIRSLNRVYQLSPIIPSEDTADFLEFATLSGELLHHHHDLEGTFSLHLKQFKQKLNMFLS